MGFLPRRKVIPGVLGSFEHLDAAIDAIGALRARGYRDLTVYCSHPNHELDAALDHKVSPVRLFTLVGGMTGCTAGFAMTIWMSRDWPVLTGGKPIVTIPPFVVIAFELTILIGALATFLGVAILSVSKARRKAAFNPRFTDDRIGIFVGAGPQQVAGADALLQEAGAVEVEHVAA